MASMQQTWPAKRETGELLRKTLPRRPYKVQMPPRRGFDVEQFYYLRTSTILTKELKRLGDGR
jgi:hypothetical protein